MLKLKQVPDDFIVTERMKLSYGEGPFFYYRLRKSNLTTEEAISRICSCFRIPRNKAGYAGIKDKRAVTFQFISLPKKVTFSAKQLSLEFLGRGEKPVYLGSHEGNEFSITVRNLSGGEIAAFKPKKSFLNQFDRQRFSSGNDEIGRLIVKDDLKKAAELLLKGSGLQEQKARQHLKSNPNDYVGALRSLPEKILLIYVHAFQARLWNEAAEKLRGERNMLVPIPGFATEFRSRKVREVYGSILSREGIGLRNFIVKKIPEVSSEGAERPLYAGINELKAGQPQADDLNGGMSKVELKFFLGKGSYATMAISELFSQNMKAAP